jgi:phosphatidylglycerophosphatase A
MPGTVGTLAGVAIAAVIAWSVPSEPAQSVALAVAVLLAGAINVMLGPWAERHWGGKDAQSVVIDEVAGYLLLFLLLDRTGPLWITLAVSFVAFRLFDIAKLPPARQCERWPQGWGVLADDLVAGVQGAVVVRLLYWAWALCID